MKKSSKKMMGFLAAASMMALAACGNSNAAGTDSAGASTVATNSSKDTLYVGLTNPMGNLSPINSSSVSTRWVQRFYFDTLVEMTKPLEFQPKLADSFETTDNQNYTIKLNPEATWTDGTPITADDVVFTLNLYANPEVETTGLYLASLEGVDGSGKLESGTAVPNLVAVDAQTVSFKTKTPMDPNFVKEMIGTNIFIQPKHVVESIPVNELEGSEAFSKPKVTSGPYKFVEYVQDSYLELAANETYYRGTPQIPSVFVRVMSATNLATELQTGGVTMNASGGIGEVSISDLEALQNVAGLTVKVQPAWTNQLMYYNTERFDQNTRLAISHAVNRDVIVDNLLKGNAEVTNGSYSSASPYMNEELAPIAYDPEKAKAYLAKSGYDLNDPLELMVPTGNKVREQSANLIEQDLEAVGFTVEQVTYDFPTTMEKGRAGEYDLYLAGIPVTVDPDATTYFSSVGSSNYTQISSPEIDGLLEKGRTETDSTKRKAIYDEFQVVMQELSPLLPLYSQKDIVVQNDALNGGIGEYWSGSLYNVHEWTLE